MKKVIIGALSVVLATSCCSTTEEIKKLETHTWKLVEMNDNENAAFKDGDSFTITFSAKDSAVAGVGACNRFFGKFELPSCEKIDIKMGGSTMMACPNMDLEQPFFQILEDADGFKFDDKFTELKLLKNGKVSAEFKIFDSSTIDTHNAANSLDYHGEYKGTFPCADCPGINIELKLNADNTFEMSYDYIDRDSEYKEKGSYKIDGNMLILNDGKNDSYYKVEENRVVKLDADKQPITGDLASMFILNKVK